jgi:hypothetical protein
MFAKDKHSGLLGQTLPHYKHLLFTDVKSFKALGPGRPGPYQKYNIILKNCEEKHSSLISTTDFSD